MICEHHDVDLGLPQVIGSLIQCDVSIALEIVICRRVIMQVNCVPSAVWGLRSATQFLLKFGDDHI